MVDERVSTLLERARDGRVVVLTGAGISAESGIPTFRGPEGYWTVGSTEYHPQELAQLGRCAAHALPHGARASRVLRSADAHPGRTPRRHRGLRDSHGPQQGHQAPQPEARPSPRSRAPPCQETHRLRTKRQPPRRRRRRRGSMPRVHFERQDGGRLRGVASQPRDGLQRCSCVNPDCRVGLACPAPARRRSRRRASHRWRPRQLGECGRCRKPRPPAPSERAPARPPRVPCPRCGSGCRR